MNKISKFDVNRTTVLVSYITQVFQYGTSIFILPFVLANLETEVMGIWYIFLSVSGIAGLLDFGFSGALSRNISYVFSGAKEIIKEGNPEKLENGQIDYCLLKSILFTSKRIYARISFAMLIILSTVGSLYIYNVTKDSTIKNVLMLWLIYSASVAFNWYFGYVNIFVRGRGLITQSNKLIIISKITYVFSVAFLIFAGCGLWSLIIGNFLGALVSRFYGLYTFYDSDLKNSLNTILKENVVDYFSTIWYNAKKFGIASFANHAFSQANIFIAGIFLNLENVAKLGLCLQLTGVLITVCRVYFNSYYPKICALWVSNNIKEIRAVFIRSQIVGYLIWFLGFVIMITLGNSVLTLLHSKTLLPEISVLLLFAFFYFMELTHGNCSMLISSKNTVPFVKASVVACITAIMLMFLFGYLKFGILGFPLAMILANLPYNSWKWVVEAYKLLK